MSFTYYDPDPVRVPGKLTDEQKAAILDAYANGKKPIAVQFDLGIHKPLVRKLFKLFKSIEEYATEAMSGTIENGEDAKGVMTYLPKVTTSQELIDACVDKFGLARIMTAILTKMVKYSKRDGSGTWKFYKGNFSD